MGWNLGENNERIPPLSNFELKLQIPLAWYSPDLMRPTKSRLEVPNQRFKGIWNLSFSKKVRFGVKTSIWALVWNAPESTEYQVVL